VVWSINSNWLRASEQKGVKPIGIVTIELQQTSGLFLTSYATLIASACSVVLNIDGVNYTVTEGTHWTAATSNAVTANNIGVAMLAAVDAVGTWVVRYRLDTNQTGTTITFVFGESANASALLTFQASTTGAPGGTFTDVGNGPTSISFCKSDTPFVSSGGTVYPNLVQDISGLEMSVDPLTREIALGTPTILLSDPSATSSLRALIGTYALIGKAVDIFVGFEGLAETDFEQWPRCYIHSVTPDADNGITLGLGDGLHELTASNVQGEWVNFHPLGALYDVLTQCIVPDRLVTADFDPTTSVYDSIGHWVVSRYNDEVFQCVNGINDPTPAINVVNSLLVLMNGTLRPAQDGTYGYKLLDENAAAIRSFENAADLSATSYPCTVTAYTDAYAALTNSAVISFAQSRDASAANATYHEMDKASIRETLRVVESTLDLEWCNGVAEVLGAYMDPGNGTNHRLFQFPFSDQIVVQYAPRQGFCGTRESYNAATSSFTPYANSQLSTGLRTAFFRLEGRAYPATNIYDYTTDPEIVACDIADHFFFASGLGPQRYDQDIANRATPKTSRLAYSEFGQTLYGKLKDVWTDTRFYFASTFNSLGFVNGRGGLGTSAAAARDGGVETDDVTGIYYYKPFRIVDITIPVDIAKRWLRRARFGLPKVTVEVSARHFDLELSDFVSMTDDKYLGHLQAALDGSAASVFEVTRKRCRLFESDPCMEYELSFLKSTLYPPSSVVAVYDPTVFIPLVVVDPDLVVTNTNDMVTNDQDADGIAESYTLKA